MPCLMMAQKKELSQARTYIKSGKNFDKAEQLMTNLLKDSANRDNEKIYQIWFQSVQKQYEAGNEKLYLHQKQDTAAFFDLTYRMFTILESLDSLDMRPNAKGVVKLDYRDDNARILADYRRNLFYGGTYHVRKGNYKKAFNFFETYIDCDRQPLFTGYDFERTDSLMPQAGYWAVSSGYRLNDALLTLRYRRLALKDESRAGHTLQYIAEAWKSLKDDSMYVATLVEGFAKFPQNTYFFPRLTDYYTAHGQLDEALAVTDKALAVNDSSRLFLFAKSTILLNMGRYAESITFSDRLIAMNDSMPEPYYNAGTAYMNIALKFDPLKEKKLLRKTYAQARPYIERYRQLAPTEKDKWAPALYRIYLNLNMGKQFDEIDRLLKK